MTAQALRSTYQVKVTLKGIRPAVWRRFELSSVTNLEDFHIALQITMGWENAHLYEFIQDRSRYGIPDDEGMLNVKNVSDFRLNQLLVNEKDSLLYFYDYGDSWEHEVVLEKILPFKTGKQLPICKEGSRACPPEDVGGPPGYYYFLEAISDPSRSEYHEQLAWVGGEYNAEEFNLDKVNALLREYC